MLSEEWKYYVRLYQKHRAKLLLSVATSIAQTLFILPVVFIVKFLFDEVLPNGDYIQLVYYGVGLMVLVFLSYALNLWSIKITLKTTKEVVTQIRHQIVEKTLKLSRQFFANNNLGKLQSSLVQDTHRLDVMSNALISQFIPQSIIVTTLAVVLVYLNWQLFLVLSIIFPTLYVFKQLLKRSKKNKVITYHQAFDNYSTGLAHLISKADLVKVQSAGEVEYAKQVELADKVKLSSFEMALFNSVYKAVQTIVTAEAGVLMLIIGGIAVGKEMMTLGALMSFYVASARMSSALNAAFSAIPSITEGNHSLTTLFNFLKQQDVEQSEGSVKASLDTDIHLESVCFSYGREDVLIDTSLSITQGKVTALLGANGVGKSTITNLILGFYQPNSGLVKIGDEYLGYCDLKFHRKQIGVVFQDQKFFSGSIEENIVYGLDNYSLEDLDEAIRLSGVASFITKLPLGLNSSIGDDGVKLSGGQKQKIAVARAIIRKPKLLILDEPTNHLDPESVSNLMGSLSSLDTCPTILLITQNEKVASQADTAFHVHKNGLVKEVSTQELAK